jgi:asparagine synthase (glutamine-hydrolysing)
MCGINGFLTSVNTNELDLNKVLNDCTDKIIHRGPDSNGFWVDSTKGIYLGHRRLSIVDLSPTGAQPMSSNGGRYTICLNGEIYNHLSIRRELKLDCRTLSDTETILEGYIAVGEKIFKMLPNQFIVFCVQIFLSFFNHIHKPKNTKFFEFFLQKDILWN